MAFYSNRHASATSNPKGALSGEKQPTNGTTLKVQKNRCPKTPVSQVSLASQERFELPTHGLEGRCSILLSYWDNNGAGDGNRTHVASLEGWSSTIELHPRQNKTGRSGRI